MSIYDTFTLPSSPLVGAALCVIVLLFAQYFRGKSHQPRGLAGEIETLARKHPVGKSFHKTITSIGGGSWPPRATHAESWPAPVRGYHEIYTTISATLSVAECDISLDDGINSAKIDLFRSRFAKLLQQKINVAQVCMILERTETDDSQFPADAYNGFYSCIAMSRHAFRWGIIPVVRAAQNQKFIEFPDELVLPWKYLCRRYGVSSLGGNVMSNYLYNLDQDGQVVYRINGALGTDIQNAECRFSKIFADLETRALPVYVEMVKAISSFEKDDYQSCLESIKLINNDIRQPLQVFYNSLTEARISRDLWLRYVQGFQGFAAGEMIDGEYVESDGLSGNQLCFFHVIDAFLGLDPYLTKENSIRYIPAAQRHLIESFQSHCFRDQASKLGLEEIKAELDITAKHMRVFRAAHKTRAIPYLKTDSPERMVMTAGKSVLKGGGLNVLESAINMLTDMLDKRFKQTI